MYLKDRANKEGECFPAIGTIARELKLSQSTVKRVIRDLERAGYLYTEQRWRENGGRSNLQFHLKKKPCKKVESVTLVDYGMVHRDPCSEGNI